MPAIAGARDSKAVDKVRPRPQARVIRRTTLLWPPLWTATRKTRLPRARKRRRVDCGTDSGFNGGGLMLSAVLFQRSPFAPAGALLSFPATSPATERARRNPL